MSSISTGELNNHCPLVDRKALQSEPLINHLPHNSHHKQLQNPNLCLNDKETASIEQLKPVVNETSLLASAMVEQPIVQTVISLVETFDGTKSKSESWIASVENVAQISGQNILHIAFSNMVGPPITSIHRVK